jgi:hypothetical protein
MNRLTYYPVKNNCSDSKACTLRGEEATLLTREEVGLKNLSTRLPSQDQPADACRRESSSVTHTEEISSSLQVKPHKERRRNAVVPLLPFLLRAPTHMGSIQLSRNMDVRFCHILEEGVPFSVGIGEWGIVAIYAHAAQASRAR